MNPEEYGRMDREELAGWWFVGKRLFVRTILHRFDVLQDGMVLLDAGCGTGAALRSFESDPGILGTGLQLHGLDPAPQALQFARRKSGAHLVCGSAERLPYRSGVFDLVLLLDVLEHLDDDRRALREAYRVLKPGGHLALTVPAFPVLWSDHDVALHHRRRYLRRGLQQILEEAGFQRRYLGCIFASVFPAAALSRLWRRFHPASVPRADIGTAPPFLNHILLQLLAREARLVRHIELPFGTSLLALARRS